MSLEFNLIYQNMRTNSDNSWLKSLFKWTALGQLFNIPAHRSSAPSPWLFIQTYLSSWWWNRLRFKSLLDFFRYDFESFVSSAKYLKKYNLFNEDNIAKLSKCKPIHRELEELQNKGLLTQENFTSITEHASPESVIRLLCNQHYQKFLITNRQDILSHEHPDCLAEAFDYLDKAKLLNIENIDHVKHHQHPDDVAGALYYLKEANLLTAQNKDHVIGANIKPEELKALVFLGIFQLLTQEIFEFNKTQGIAPHPFKDLYRKIEKSFPEHRNKESLALALYHLSVKKLLSPEIKELLAGHLSPYSLIKPFQNELKEHACTKDNLETLRTYFDSVVTHKTPSTLFTALITLRRNNLLVEPYLDEMFKSPHPAILAKILEILKNAKNLNPEIFQILMNPNYSEFLTSSILPRHILGSLIRANLLNTDNFKRLSNDKLTHELNWILDALNDANILTQDNFTIVANHANPNHLYSVLLFSQGAGILTQKNFTVVANHANPDNLARALNSLQRAGILTQENFNVITNHVNPGDLADSLFSLHRAGILTQENFTVVANHANPDNLARALNSLQRAGILTQENFTIVAKHANPGGLAWALSRLHEVRILTPENRNVVANHANPLNLAQALVSLQDTRILTPENRNVVANHANPRELAVALTSLHRAGILTQDNRTIVANHANPDNLANALSSLQRAGILTQDNRTIVANHVNPHYLADALTSLQGAGILTQDNRNVVVNHATRDSLASALTSLQGAGILTQDNFTIVANHANPDNLASALNSLQGAGILTPENRDVVANHVDPRELAWALSRLHEVRILTPENRDVVANHANPRELAWALSRLHEFRILTPENRDVFANHATPGYLAQALSSLQDARILTQENFTIVANSANPRNLAQALTSLQGAGILTQVNFNALVHPAHASLLTNEAYRRVWGRIPDHRLTQANFTRLLVASERPNPMQELQRVTADIIGLVDVEARPAQVFAARPAQAFNGGQSTHTTSVHRSVSESARKLMDNYGRDLDLEAKIYEISTYVNSLESSLKHDAAKRCITNITAPGYFFTDTSGVSTRQLLALAFTAIHDDTKRIGTLEDAKAQFIQALYEIQRGYNLNDGGHDMGGEDYPICTGGTFNKIMEKLNGIHTDVEIYYITPQGANFKFPKLAEVHALQYLRSIASPNTAEDYQQSKAIIDRIQQNDSLEPIWDNIKDSVAREIWGEFKEAYGDNSQDRLFLDLINVGCEYLEAPEELPEIKAQLLASDGYQQLIGLQMRDLFNSSQSHLMARLHEHSLWANRHASPEFQEAFDKRYGLAIIPSK